MYPTFGHLDLDECLGRVIDHLAERWRRREVGIVAAGLFFQNDEPILATSTYGGQGRWVHAEKNVIDLAVRSHDATLVEGVMVVTLSPCVRSISASRVGPPCFSLLLERGVKRAHVGVIDPLDEMSCEDYRQRGLELSVTSDENKGKACGRLLKIFSKYGSRVNFDLPNIKSELGEEVEDELRRGSVKP